MRRRQVVLCGAFGLGLVSLVICGSNALAAVIPVPDGNFTDPTPHSEFGALYGAYINTYPERNSTSYSSTYTSPMTSGGDGTLSGWNVVATPSTANGGTYEGGGADPFGIVENENTQGYNSGHYYDADFDNAGNLNNEPFPSGYNLFCYYPGEQYNSGSVVTGAQPGASLTMTTTGISATAVTGTTYTASIDYANISQDGVNNNNSANVALNILANGVVVGTGTLPGLAVLSPWTPVTATWTDPGGYDGQAIQIQVVATNFLEGGSAGPEAQYQVPTNGFTDATLTSEVVPEPTGLAVLALGGGALLIRRRKPLPH
jgi:hypothetical protein